MDNADQIEIDRITRAFYEAFTSPESGPIDMSGLRKLFLDEARIAMEDDSVPNVMDLKSFVEPREVMFNNGRLQNFSERELSAQTQIFGGIAQRWSLYSRIGTLDGAPFDGWGRMAFLYLHNGGGLAHQRTGVAERRKRYCPSAFVTVVFPENYYA